MAPDAATCALTGRGFLVAAAATVVDAVALAAGAADAWLRALATGIADGNDDADEDEDEEDDDDEPNAGVAPW